MQVGSRAERQGGDQALPEIINDAQIHDAIVKSGYLLEHRLEQVLVNSTYRYSVEASPMFPDPLTGKLREIDLEARTANILDPSFGVLWPILLIECTNNLQPLGLITKVAGQSPLEIYDAKLAGIPTKVLCDENWRGMRSEEYGFILDLVPEANWHHYKQGRYATQYFTFVQKKGTEQWMAFHDNDHHDVFGKLVNAVDTLTDRLYATYTPGESEFVNLELFYPVLVVSGRLLDVRYEGSVTIRDTEHILYRRSSIRDGEASTTVIDVMTEAYFPTFLETINKEVLALSQTIAGKMDLVNRSMSALAETFRSSRPATTSDARKLLSFQ